MTVEVLYEPLYLARPYGVQCSACGVFAACVTREEAEESKKTHLGKHQAHSLFGKVA